MIQWNIFWTNCISTSKLHFIQHLVIYLWTGKHQLSSSQTGRQTIASHSAQKPQTITRWFITQPGVVNGMVNFTDLPSYMQVIKGKRLATSRLQDNTLHNVSNHHWQNHWNCRILDYPIWRNKGNHGINISTTHRTTILLKTSWSISKYIWCVVIKEIQVNSIPQAMDWQEYTIKP